MSIARITQLQQGCREGTEEPISRNILISKDRPVYTRPLGVFGFYLALSVVFLAPISLSPEDLAVNDGDPLHISWILAWDAHQAVHHPLRLFDSNSFYPYDSSLAFSEHLLGPALLAAPFFYATGNALLAQNVTLVLTLALSAFAMYLLTREVLGQELGALVAGLVYTFHTYGFHEAPRLQLLSIEWWPLAALFLHRTFLSGRFRNAALSALFFTLQGLSCTYYLFYFALALLIFVMGYALFTERGLARAAALAIPYTISGAIFAVLALPYLRMIRDFGFGRALAEGVDFAEYVRPPSGSVFGALVSFEESPVAAPQFLGFLAIALALWGIRSFPRAKEPRIRAVFFWLSVTTAVVGGVLSLGPTLRFFGLELGAGPYAWLYEGLPFFRVLRNAERMSVLLHFGLAVAAGVGASALAPVRNARWLRIALLIALPYEHFTGGQPFTRLPTSELTPAVFQWLEEKDGEGAVVELPLYPREKLRLHSLYMFFSTVHWKPIVFGRTSFYPPLTGYLAWEMRGFPDSDSIALLEGLGVERVVVHPNLWPPGEREEKLALLSAFADRLLPEGRFGPAEDPSQTRYGFGDERVFRLRHSGEEPSVSDLCVPAGEIEPLGWTLRGDSKDPAEWIVDRNRETKWRTDGQLPGMKLEIDLGREETLSAVRLELAYPHDQFPRDLTLKARTEGGAGFDRIEHRNDRMTKWDLVEALVEGPASAAIVLRFPPTKARVLRFWIQEGKEWDFSLPSWSLPELRLYRECAASH